MPVYEYRCLDCKRRFEIQLSYEEYDHKEVHCIHCDSTRLRRQINRVRIARSEDSRLEDMADPSALEGLEDDPRELGRMMRKMSAEMGEDLGPEFDEVVDRLEKGQSPEEIEEALPDLGGGEGDFGGMDGF